VSGYDDIMHYMGHDVETPITVIDKLLAATILRIIPRWITPNQFTVVRFVCIPFIIILLLRGEYFYSFILFAFAALTDAIDGALARTRGQITLWGKAADPFADKLLIGSVTLILVSQYIGVWQALALVFIEGCIVARSLTYMAIGKWDRIGARGSGKIKMVLQTIALLLLFVYILVGAPWLLAVATVVFYISLVASLVSLLFYVSA